MTCDYCGADVVLVETRPMWKHGQCVCGVRYSIHEPREVGQRELFED